MVELVLILIVVSIVLFTVLLLLDLVDFMEHKGKSTITRDYINEDIYEHKEK